MTTLQEYLQAKYPSLEDKKQVQELILTSITEVLEGGELDLSEFSNLEKVEISTHFLSTPLTKIITTGLTKLKEIVWEQAEEDSAEDKKLWEELGIAGDIFKKKVVREVQRLAKIKAVEVKFGEADKENHPNAIFLNLDQKDKQDNFYPNLAFWNLARELTNMEIGEEKTTKSPEFWKQFEENRIWVKENLKEEYQKEFELLLTPSTFPYETIEVGHLAVYFPNLEAIPNAQIVETRVGHEIVDKTWQTIREELLNLLSQELKNNPSEEQLKELALKATIDYNSNEQEYIIQVNYNSNCPFKEKIKELTTATPLQLENELLKQKKDQLPSLESFEKLKKQIQAWENTLLNQGITEEEFNQIKEKINKD